MQLFEEFYVLFNRCECLLWWTFFLYIVFQAFLKKHRGSLLLAELLMAVGFFVFGLSDYVESSDQGAPPWWLWLWKITNGCFLFSMMMSRDYLLRGKVALNPWRFIAAGFILSAAIYLALKN